MRTSLVGVALLVVAVVLAVAGQLPADRVLPLAERVVPVLGFVVAITIVAELAALAGVFRSIAEGLTRLSRGRGIVLWLWVCLLSAIATAFLSLDTAAVLLTPIVIIVARHCGLPPVPFALTTVWIANTGSLFLPVSNLTNLLAAGRLGADAPLEFLALMGLPALAAVVAPLLVILAVFHRQLARPLVPEAGTRPEDAVLFRIAVAVLALLLPALVSGIEVWIPASIAAGILLIATAVRRASALGPHLIPWPVLLFASGLFLVIESTPVLAAVDAVVAPLAGAGSSAVDLGLLAALGATGANLLNNLPAYLVLEPFAGEPLRLAALLIGVNAGPLVTPWASLATLLWHRSLVQHGVEISWWRFAGLGLVAAPLSVGCAVAVLIVTAG